MAYYNVTLRRRLVHTLQERAFKRTTQVQTQRLYPFKAAQLIRYITPIDIAMDMERVPMGRDKEKDDVIINRLNLKTRSTIRKVGF